MMKLPKNLEIRYRDELEAFEQEKQMAYVNSIERLAIEEGEARGERQGLLAGISLALKLKFGGGGLDLSRQASAITDVQKLRRVLAAIENADSLEEIHHLIAVE